VNVHDQLTKLAQVDPMHQRIDQLVERETGALPIPELTVQCCNGFHFTGPTLDALAHAEAHRAEHHPASVKHRKHPPRAVSDQIGRENGARISAEMRKQARDETTE